MNHYLIIDEYGSAYRHSGPLPDELREGLEAGVLVIYDITEPSEPIRHRHHRTLTPHSNNMRFYITYKFNDTAIVTVTAIHFAKTDDNITFTDTASNHHSFPTASLLSILPAQARRKTSR